MDKSFHASTRSQRFLVWLTIVLAVVFAISYVGLMRFFPPPPASLSAEEVAPLYSEHNIRFRIGVIFGLISGGFLVPITIVISLQMARLEKGVPIWAILQALTGVVGTVFVWLPVLVWGVASFTAERAPELTLLIHEFGWLLFITPLSLFPMQLLGIIVVAFTKDEPDGHSAFPRWMGYLTAWQLVQSFGGPIAVLFKTGIFSWAGLLPFWAPFALFSAWLAAICYTVLRALRHQQQLAATGG
ncbi:MAG: hypothetical protein H6917_16240 [Novosphingobium sp.]|nr:hypothetical protein [Novosphingobium sp.]MCP5403922.1 hypothetical protein [Novosphingobium sp.]